MRKRVTLSGNRMTSKEALHTYLAKKLAFPAYYGKNLDALHDCLCERSTPLRITVTYADRLKENLGNYGEALLQVLQDAAEENKMITLSLFSNERHSFRTS